MTIKYLLLATLPIYKAMHYVDKTPEMHQITNDFKVPIKNQINNLSITLQTIENNEDDLYLKKSHNFYKITPSREGPLKYRIIKIKKKDFQKVHNETKQYNISTLEIIQDKFLPLLIYVDEHPYTTPLVKQKNNMGLLLIMIAILILIIAICFVNYIQIKNFLLGKPLKNIKKIPSAPPKKTNQNISEEKKTKGSSKPNSQS